MKQFPLRVIAVGSVLTVLSAQPAHAVDVSLSGLVTSQCVLSLTTPGSLAPSVDGKQLGSAETGGLAATLSVLGTGITPTLTFGAPSLNAPSGSAGATPEISYTSLGGANQAYTSAQSTTSSSLIDTFTVHARVSKDTGFDAGNHTITTVVTCAQP